MKAFLFIIFTIVIFLTSKGQSKTDLVKTSMGRWEFPINHVISIDTMTIDCFGARINAESLTLYTNTSEEVKSIEDGTVAIVSNLGNEYLVLIHSGNYFISYMGLSKPELKKNDVIKKGNVIGKLTKEEADSSYQLIVMLYSKNASQLNINRWFNWHSFACQSDSFTASSTKE